MCFAQNGINYKAQIRDGAGDIVANDLIQIQFTILLDGDPVYEETHSPTTDANGVIIVTISEGTPIAGNFYTINWENGEYFLNVKVNTGTGLTDLGTTAFRSVPYAEFAKSSTAGAIVLSPPYLDTNFSDFQLISGDRIRITVEFNIKMNPASFAIGSSVTLTGAGGNATGTLQWSNGNTRLVITSNEAFTTIAPCFTGGMLLTIKGGGANKALDSQGKVIDGNKDGVNGGDYTVTFDIVC
tara:strand:- start:1801 stop:2523 length:723 start_codon:yes stop_codon:yes gene_type:complete